jgi:signal transduction histidine kinase
MRERAALVAGTFDLESPASGGTRVRLRVPVGNHQSSVVQS